MDFSAVAVPAGLRPDGLHFGIRLIGKAFQNDALLTLADRVHRSFARALGGSNRNLNKHRFLRLYSRHEAAC